MINIAAISFCYDAVEDRVRLIGNMDNGQPRIDFWLTRSLVLRLLKASSKFIKSSSDRLDQVPIEHRSAMAQFEHDRAQLTEDIQQVANVDHTQHLSVLLKRLDISIKEHRYQLSFFTEGSESPVAVSVLTEAEMHRVLSLIHAGSKHLDWGFGDFIFDQDATPMRLQ